MRKHVVIFALACVACVACAPTTAPAPQGPVRLEQAWVVTGLASPESVIASNDPDVLYISNVGGEGEVKDGNGFIARVSREGRVLQRDWATGLNAPKGMALHNGALYVSDIDQLVELNAATGAVRGRYPGGSFLNDVAVLRDGTVLAADSGGSRIYALRNGALEEWAAGPLLDSVNGLLPEGERVVVTTMSGRLLAIDVASKAITELSNGIAQGDGVARLDDGSYLATEWPGRIFQVSGEGAVATLLDTRGQNIFQNDILLMDGVLYVPNWQPGTLTAYRVSR